MYGWWCYENTTTQGETSPVLTEALKKMQMHKETEDPIFEVLTVVWWN